MANVTEKVWWVETESETANEVNDPQLGLAQYSRIDENVTYTHLSEGKEIKIYGSVYDEDFIQEDNGVATTTQATPGDWGTPGGGNNYNVAPYATSGSGTGLLCSYTVGSGNPTFTVTTPGYGYAVGDTVNFKDPTSSGSAITLTISTLTIPSGKIGISESPNIPEDFHDALTHFVIMKGYEMKPEAIQLAQYFENKWNMCINEGKEYSNTDMQGSTPSIIPYDF